MNIYDPPATDTTTPQADLLGDWNKLITQWLNTSYAKAGAWCVPPESTLKNGSTPTNEDAYINKIAPKICSNGSSCGSGGTNKCSDGNACLWGTLPQVIACLNYNSGRNTDGSKANVDSSYGNAVYNYQQCLNALVAEAGSCSSLPDQCTSQVLGRSLETETRPSTISCDPTVSGSFANWVSNSLILFTDEAPKFALRSAFLTDLYNRATTMQRIFSQGHTALANFFKTCDGCSDGTLCGSGGTNTCTDGSACDLPKCAAGGPAAQLVWARTHGSPAEILPNSLIYGWVDNTYPNGHRGYAHIVKVTAFSPGREGTTKASTFVNGVSNMLPWINTWETWALRKYALSDRDGNVYVSVKRWDEDHGDNPVTFPNGHTLWQFLFNTTASNNAPDVSGAGLIGACNGLNLGAGSCPALSGSGNTVGFGLLPETIQGLRAAQRIPSGGNGCVTINNDNTALSNAFMLNDEGDGNIDPNLRLQGGAAGTACAAGANDGTNSTYCTCLSEANKRLALGFESHACARYVASQAGQDPSPNGDSDYSLKFIDCHKVAGYPKEDLLYQGE